MLKSPMTISELALRVLQHPRGGVSALLDLVDRNETEWLELFLQNKVVTLTTKSYKTKKPQQ